MKCKKRLHKFPLERLYFCAKITIVTHHMLEQKLYESASFSLKHFLLAR